ncbi:PilZ domain-containing protein [Tsuneonella amylolytica]|uniref:PilZ domain-containing protein n=1 Tax=Tsuneonella amylolytica TaxID=2338327 RepID=UPI0013C47B15|nr:PilZ domain-containing protein [Tsuneonella amylolytica]
MSADDTFFVARKGRVWACFLDGRPAVDLGPEAVFWTAAEAFAEERFPQQDCAPTPQFASPSLIAPAPVAAERLPPAVSSRTVNERSQERREVSIVGRVFAAGGSREVIIHDLSEQGCRIEDRSQMKLREGGHVTVRIGEVGPIPATVRWMHAEEIGLRFDNPLYPSVLDHIHAQFGRR